MVFSSRVEGRVVSEEGSRGLREGGSGLEGVGDGWSSCKITACNCQWSRSATEGQWVIRVLG